MVSDPAAWALAVIASGVAASATVDDLMNCLRVTDRMSCASWCVLMSLLQELGAPVQRPSAPSIRFAISVRRAASPPWTSAVAHPS